MNTNPPVISLPHTVPGLLTQATHLPAALWLKSSPQIWIMFLNGESEGKLLLFRFISTVVVAITHLETRITVSLNGCSATDRFNIAIHDQQIMPTPRFFHDFSMAVILLEHLLISKFDDTCPTFGSAGDQGGFKTPVSGL